ncbi:hypothetical protein J3F84DRAFT_386286 [Trichoderma pleuroticola]
MEKSRHRNAPCFGAPNAPLLQVSECRCALDMGVNWPQPQPQHRHNPHRTVSRQLLLIDFSMQGVCWLLMLPIPPGSGLLPYWAGLRRCIQAYLGLGRGNKHLLSLFRPLSVHGLPVPSGGEASAAFIHVSMLSSWLTALTFLRGGRLFLAMRICFIFYFLR